MNRKLLPVIHELFANLSGYTVHLSPETFAASGAPVPATTFMQLLAADGPRHHLSYLPARLPAAAFLQLLHHATYPVLFFRIAAGQVYPVVIKRSGKHFELYQLQSNLPERQTITNLEHLLENCFTLPDTSAGEPLIPYVTCILQPASNPAKTGGAAGDKKQPSPLHRFFQLLAPEKREIGYLYIYAAIAGIISLSLPLGVQSIIGFISAGQVTASVVVLIAVIVAGTLVTGDLQLMQVWLVEYLQQRLFSRMAFNFAHRVPKFQLEGLQPHHPVELMNRFFETVTLQKGLEYV
ncbi:hypothetical protein [Adhaeribacter pallidiroseus]|uniref:Uncharacterized protein n=1 Tax=Adhaeribacter pallidiroseus TaxID=2072847 RepID=A0A369QI81_9BACT|nr:hypothetical protein [Adhaeribacter pallidiroseus]RDC64601.1 hypothetical protein AHMF7616_03217 [Adhaeribacter pallidiroseus]